MPAFSTIALTTISAAGAGFSFAEAGKQRKIERQAQRDAEKALAEARKKLEVNYLKGLSIAKEPYELEREALLQQGASALAAGVAGDPRGAAATAGRVVQAQQAAQAQQRAQMAKEMQQLDLLAAQEEAALQSQRVGLDIGEAKGQQMIAADARRAAAAATQAGVQGIVDIAMTGLESRDLYADSPEARAARQERRAGRKLERQMKRGTRQAARDIRGTDYLDLDTGGIYYQPMFDMNIPGLGGSMYS